MLELICRTRGPSSHKPAFFVSSVCHSSLTKFSDIDKRMSRDNFEVVYPFILKTCLLRSFCETMDIEIRQLLLSFK